MARRRMQMVFQDPLGSLDPRQSVQSILVEGMQAHGLADSDADDQRPAAGAAVRGRAAEHRAAQVPARVLRRAAAADRHRPGADREPGADRRRRAGLRAGRLGAGPGDQPAGGPAGRPRPDLPGHRARPRGGPAHLRPGRRDVPGRAGRGGDVRGVVRGAAAPVHPGADVRGAGAGPGGGGQPGADPAHRRPAVTGEPADRLPVPHPLPVAAADPVRHRPARADRAAQPGIGWPATTPPRSPPGRCGRTS